LKKRAKGLLSASRARIKSQILSCPLEIIGALPRETTKIVSKKRRKQRMISR
jgi:hypothetical protein